MEKHFSQDDRLNDPVARLMSRLGRYKSPVRNRNVDRLTQTDLRNAIALLQHLLSCHRAALEVPGIGSALVQHAFVSPFDGDISHAGIHMDHAYGFVEDLLGAAQRWCAEQIEESPPREAPKAIGVPLPTPQLRDRKVQRLRARQKQ